MPTTLLRPQQAFLYIDERAARRELRRQIAAIERRLTTPAQCSMRSGAPRLLRLGELERVRDELLGAEARARATARTVAADVSVNRRLLEAMRADPSRHRFRRMPLAALGQPGCGVYRVRPRLGIVGMLAGWWELTLSSGCP